MNYISKSYYEPISNINEISDDIKISIFNKNIKIENVTDDKIKITVTVFSSINHYKIYFELIKGFDIKSKYIQMIKELRLRNEMLANNEIIQSKKSFFLEQKNKNNNIKNKNNSIQNNNNQLKNDEKNKKMTGKKRRRFPAKKASMKKKEKENKENKDRDEEKEEDSKEKESFIFNDSSYDNDNENDNSSEQKKFKNEIENVLNNMFKNMDDSNINQSYKNKDKKRIKFIPPHNLRNMLNKRYKKDEPYVALNNSLEADNKK